MMQNIFNSLVLVLLISLPAALNSAAAENVQAGAVYRALERYEQTELLDSRAKITKPTKPTQPIFISLGRTCEVSWNLYKRSLNTLFFPFDWAGTPDFDAVTTLIKNDFDDFFNIKNLIRVDEYGDDAHFGVYDTKSCVLLAHDFPKDKTIEESLEAVKEKCTRRIERFKKALTATNHIYFIRREITAEQAARFVSMIKAKYPALRFTLVCIDKDPSFKQPLPVSNTLSFFYQHKKQLPGPKWQGDPALWDTVLKALGASWTGSVDLFAMIASMGTENQLAVPIKD
jgi:hypothetical protein